MATHLVELAIRRFYRVYVEDDSDSMTESQLLRKAKEMALESEDNLDLDTEIDIEEHDILDGYYEYDID